MNQHYLMKYMVVNRLGGVGVCAQYVGQSGVSDWVSDKFNLVYYTADSTVFYLFLLSK